MPLRSAIAALLLAALAHPALAQEPDAAPASAWTFEAYAGAVSDYRFRGVSLSGEEPAVQAGATLSHASGVYGDIFVSQIEEYGVGPDGDGADIEATFTLGWAGSWLGLDWNAAVSSYRYPDGDDVNAVEIPVQAGRTHGDLTWTVGAVWAPQQTALGDEDNRYLWAGLGYAPETWPVSLAATLGHEDGAWAPGGKTDWLVGAYLPLGAATAGLEWVDSDMEDGTLIASLFVGF